MMAFLLNISPVAELPSPTSGTDWALGLFLVLFIGLAWIRVTHPKRLPQVFRMFVYQRFVRQAMREEELLATTASIILTVIFIASGGMLLFLIAASSDVLSSTLSVQGPLLYLILCVLILIVYLLKYVFIKFLQFIFSVDQGINEYLYNTWLLNVVLGICLLPLIITATFADWEGTEHLLKIGIGLACSFFLYRIGRGIRTGFSNNVSPLYLFLYLCTLEFLPLVALSVVFVERFV